jgi:hypothetical protein
MMFRGLCRWPIEDPVALVKPTKRTHPQQLRSGPMTVTKAKRSMGLRLIIQPRKDNTTRTQLNAGRPVRRLV